MNERYKDRLIQDIWIKLQELHTDIKTSDKYKHIDPEWERVLTGIQMDIEDIKAGVIPSQLKDEELNS